ncbi:hypothetical protein JCM11491_007061 [Sporobolomyces phaffii]
MAPIAPAPRPVPQFHLETLRLDNPGSKLFFSHVQPYDILYESAVRVIEALYPITLPGLQLQMPSIRSVRLFLRDMDGVAYTQSSDLDEEHKEIHLSTRYLQTVFENSERNSGRLTHEIAGVLTHELVHVFQYNGSGSVPGGVIEGIADWVRNEQALAPPHWREGPGHDASWDAGYETTGFFLRYLTRKYDPLLVPKLNSMLQVHDWAGGEHLKGLIRGQKIESVWEEYKQSLVSSADSDATAAPPVPTHATPGYRPAYR